MSKSIQLLFLVLCASSADAATYYVATNGSNTNPGTQASPFATLQKAHDVAVAGDTIFMRGGVYNTQGPILITRDGTSGNRIKLFAFPCETPILDGSSSAATGNWLLRLNGGNWWHIKGIEIRNHNNGGGMVLTSSSSNNIIENNNIHHNGNASAYPGEGLAIFDGGNNLILNNDFHHNKDSNNGDGDGMNCVAPQSGTRICGNRSWRNSDDGYDMWACAPAVFDSNWSAYNGLNDAGSPLGDGNGFKLGGSAATTIDGGHTMKYNVAWGNRTVGFNRNQANNPFVIYHSTAYNNGSSNYGLSNTSDVVRNSLSLGTFGQVAGSQTFNSWTVSPAVTVTTADFQSIIDSCALGPRQADGSLPNCTFLRLVSGSDLIDKGTASGIPTAGCF